MLESTVKKKKTKDKKKPQNKAPFQFSEIADILERANRGICAHYVLIHRGLVGLEVQVKAD